MLVQKVGFSSLYLSTHNLARRESRVWTELKLLLFFRFFEGRAHVGNMVKTCRELARAISTYTVGTDKKTEDKRANCARLMKAYTLAVKLSCRKTEGTQFTLLMDFLTSEEYEQIKAMKKNFPMIILFWLGKAIAEFDGQLLFPRAMDFMEREVLSPYFLP